MAEPADTYPDDATKGGSPGRDGHRDSAGQSPERVDGEAQIRAALDAHGDDLAAALDQTDHAADIVETAIIVVANADEEDLDAIAESTGNAVAAADGLTTDEAAALAEELGENAEDLAAVLDALLELQRAGQLDDLLELAKAVSTLDVDEDTTAGLNGVLGAVGEAQRTAEPVGIVGLVRGLTSRDARAGLGYLLALLKAQGRRVRRR